MMKFSVYVCLLFAAAGQAQEAPKQEVVIAQKIEDFTKQLKRIREEFEQDARKVFAGAGKTKDQKLVEFFDKKYAPVLDSVFTFAVLNKNNQSIVEHSAGWAFNFKAYQRDLLGALSKDEAKGITKLAYQLPEFRQAKEVQKALPTNSYLIEFVRFKNNAQGGRPWYAAWLVPSLRIEAVAGRPAPPERQIELLIIGPATTDPGDADSHGIDQLVLEMYRNVSESGPRQDINTHLSHVRDRLFGKQVWQKMQERDAWIISPVADLWLIPFTALPLPFNSASLKLKDFELKENMPKYWAIESHKISYLVSGRELVEPPKAINKAGDVRWPALVVGDPQYEQKELKTSHEDLRWQRVLESLSFKGDHPAEGWPTAGATGESVVFFRHRQRTRFYYVPCPPPPPPPSAKVKGHLLVGELYQPKGRSRKGFDVLGGLSFSPVPGLKDIMKNLQATFNAGSVFLSEAEATEDAFVRRSPVQQPVVVFAGHGFYLDPKSKQSLLVEHPDPFKRCGLALALAKSTLDNKDPNEVIEPNLSDGILTGHEILTRLDLGKTGLTLLIACQTGVGAKVPSGDALATVRQACQVAGSPLVLATTWEVAVGEDPATDPTTLIMKRFCDQLQTRSKLNLRSCEELLRDAQLAYMFESGRRRSPNLWAAFSVTGYSLP